MIKEVLRPFICVRIYVFERHLRAERSALKQDDPHFSQPLQ
jgi:hypothetical protein